MREVTSQEMNRRKRMVWRVNHQEQPGTRERLQGITCFFHSFPLYLFRVNLGAFPEHPGDGSRNGRCEARTATGEAGTIRVTRTVQINQINPCL